MKKKNDWKIVARLFIAGINLIISLIDKFM